MANKTGNALLSLGLLLLVAVALWGVPKLPSLPEPTRIIELPCKPTLSLLRWWDYDRVWGETDGGWSKKPASTNVEYWHNGEKIISRTQLHRTDFDRNQPYVAWRAVIGSEVHIELGGPESEVFKNEIRRCERLPVVFSRLDESPHLHGDPITEACIDPKSTACGVVPPMPRNPQ